MALLILFLLSANFTAAQNDSAAGEFTISTDVNLVLLDVSVKDSKGGYATGLAKDNFRIFEDGAEQKITQFSSADVPVTIGLVIDESGSMHTRRADVITAGLVFIGASNPLDQIFVVSFNDKVRVGLPPAVPFSSDIKLLTAALSRDQAAGQTALYDAITYSLAHLEKGHVGRKALMVVSDGGDNCSRNKLNDVMQMVHTSPATIYTVGIFSDDDPDQKPQVLERMSSVSGGQSFLPKTLDEIAPTCRNIAQDIRSRYTVGYIPSQSAGNRGPRKIRVVASAADRGKLVVRTRTSYVPPGAR